MQTVEEYLALLPKGQQTEEVQALIEEMIADAALKRDEGQSAGYDAALEWDEGPSAAYDAGYSDGKSDGYDDGRQEGYDEGYKKGLQDASAEDDK